MRQDKQVVKSKVAEFRCENSSEYLFSATCSVLSACIFLIFSLLWKVFSLLVNLKESLIVFLAVKSKGTMNNHGAASD